MVCANPDIVVERGDELVYCAGALADAYAALGGEVLYCGKPHAPIYQAALGQAAAFRGGETPPLQAGAGDRRFGANRSQRRGAFGVDCLFVVSGIHAEEFGGRDAPDLVRRSRDVCGRRRGAEGGDAPAGMVSACAR
jgi:hypothetical protein